MFCAVLVVKTAMGAEIICSETKVPVYYFPVLVLPSSLNLNSQVQHDN
ncbi:Uncharacterised protein [Yersinia pseudotuberculosis]|uniref:Uncharacterized protein n=2 Tax=Yersinia pseudotuberculosis complex TaxID=1649845 RepID=A0A380Q570_YERPU|nr:Uncharacterised protein [Yersinia pseudotuberculosis]CRG49207.1 Uncharacterised protein [Yersinia wautersii]SUP80965.1 Uncharacterised protein [Yersinia pseudotuberculosis]